MKWKDLMTRSLAASFAICFLAACASPGIGAENMSESNKRNLVTESPVRYQDEYNGFIDDLKTAASFGPKEWETEFEDPKIKDPWNLDTVRFTADYCNDSDDTQKFSLMILTKEKSISYDDPGAEAERVGDYLRAKGWRVSSIGQAGTGRFPRIGFTGVSKRGNLFDYEFNRFGASIIGETPCRVLTDEPTS